MAILSTDRLSKMMLEKLIALPFGTKNLKDNVALRLGLVGQFSTSRDINAAWEKTKKKAAKLYPDKFVLDDRGVLHWDDGNVKILDKNISRENYKKLNELAVAEDCTVNSLVSKLVANYKKAKKRYS